MEIKCEFKFTVEQKRYYCHFESAEITKRNTLITAFVGNHSPGKTNEDVEGVIIIGSKLKVEYFPRGLGDIFPNLKVIFLHNCGLKELKKRDLIGLEGLTELHLFHNHFESLPSNLLKDMKNLTHVEFVSNSLKFIDSRMFDHIKNQLVKLRFYQNYGGPYIDAFYDQKDQNSKGATQTIDELLKTIDEKFVKPKADQEKHFHFKQLWSSGRFSDFIVIVEKKEFKVHKNVLGIQSPVFAAMFENDMEECKSGKVTFNDFSAGAVEEFLQFLYTGEIPYETNAMEVFALAFKYDVKALKLEMEKTIVMNIERENAIEILKLGNLYDSEVLKSVAFDELKFANPELKLSDHMKNKPEEIAKLFETKRPRDLKASKKF